MKKYIFTFLVLTSVLISGCSLDFGNTGNINNSEEVIDTSDWLTYRNEEYGFEFKYPMDWEIEAESGRNITVFNTDAEWPSQESVPFSINMFSNFSIETFIEEYNNSAVWADGTTFTVIKENEPYTVNGILGTKLIGSTEIGADRAWFIISNTDNESLVFSFSDSNKYHLAILDTLKID